MLHLYTSFTPRTSATPTRALIALIALSVALVSGVVGCGSGHGNLGGSPTLSRSASTEPAPTDSADTIDMPEPTEPAEPAGETEPTDNPQATGLWALLPQAAGVTQTGGGFDDVGLRWESYTTANGFDISLSQLPASLGMSEVADRLTAAVEGANPETVKLSRNADLSDTLGCEVAAFLFDADERRHGGVVLQSANGSVVLDASTLADVWSELDGESLVSEWASGLELSGTDADPGEPVTAPFTRGEPYCTKLDDESGDGGCVEFGQDGTGSLISPDGETAAITIDIVGFTVRMEYEGGTQFMFIADANNLLEPESGMILSR